MAAKQANTTVPILYSIYYPGIQLATSLLIAWLDRVGDIIGISNCIIELSAQRLQYFKEAVVGLPSVGLLVNPRDPDNARRSVEEMKAAAAQLK